MRVREPTTAGQSMIRDAHYRAKLPFRGRGHAELVQRVGGVYGDIDERLGRGGTVRVLELGCGYGTALLDLWHRYGGRIELHGINRLPGDGDAATLLKNAVERGLVTPGVPLAHPLPTIA